METDKCDVCSSCRWLRSTISNARRCSGHCGGEQCFEQLHPVPPGRCIARRGACCCTTKRQQRKSSRSWATVKRQSCVWRGIQSAAESYHWLLRRSISCCVADLEATATSTRQRWDAGSVLGVCCWSRLSCLDHTPMYLASWAGRNAELVVDA